MNSNGTQRLEFGSSREGEDEESGRGRERKMNGGRRKGKGERGKGQGERDEREEKGFCSGRDEGYDKDKGKTKDSNHLDEA